MATPDIFNVDRAPATSQGIQAVLSLLGQDEAEVTTLKYMTSRFRYSHIKHIKPEDEKACFEYLELVYGSEYSLMKVNTAEFLFIEKSFFKACALRLEMLLEELKLTPGYLMGDDIAQRRWEVYTSFQRVRENVSLTGYEAFQDREPMIVSWLKRYDDCEFSMSEFNSNQEVCELGQYVWHYLPF